MFIHSKSNLLFNEMLKLNVPLILAPMAGVADSAMAIAVAHAGGLGSIACALLNEQQIRDEVHAFRDACPDKPLNLNFFCHPTLGMSESQEKVWQQALANYYQEFNLDPKTDPAFQAPFVERKPFDENICALLEELQPEVVSFHFGLPHAHLVERLKTVGCKILSSATTLNEAIWLEKNGCDAIIAQGLEAGGHRGMFLSDDLSSQVGTMALLPQIVDRVSVPVIAAGGIADGRGVAAAFALGAAAVQIGTAYLLTNESKISAAYRSVLMSSASEETVLTNLFSGKPARGVVNRLIRELGAISPLAPPFPFAGKALAPLKSATEQKGSGDFISLWCGQNLRRDLISAEELTLRIWEEAHDVIGDT
ncbi:NAD(P)H-dependent flavin oxidoreductase [Pseudobdellovibrio exovorus]|uniref:Nitronate monooxygenase n=1 Tax=Pseudobdellovibrio exovorus JSS TaxID=1184267 RepID=M4V5J7_9BACT|nr:nitronate monooxygenase family protein [Pseudobdellovibrio exovorus]AGH94458.1 hypothetical protein A11Q_238 [Pseudobdellovibrio exovorus JSS]